MLSLEMQLRVKAGADSRPSINHLEESVKEILKAQADLELGIPSSAISVDGNLIESCFLIAKSEAALDLAAEALVSKVSGCSLSDDAALVLIKRKGGESPTEQIRNVLPITDSGWSEIWRSPSRVSRVEVGSEQWPEQLRYIATVADRYYGVGGNEVVAVFRNAGDLRKFTDTIGRSAVDEILAIARAVISNADHLHIMDWFNEAVDGEIGWPRTKALYFLALLERLREEGFLDAIPNIAGFHFIDWNKMGG